MTIASLNEPSADVPYSIPLDDGSRLAIAVPAAWTRIDRDGSVLLLPPAIRMIDRLRALFAASHPTLGSIVSLREALFQTSAEFARSLDVAVERVDAWEHGTAVPSTDELAAISRLAAAAACVGIRVDGVRRS